MGDDDLNLFGSDDDLFCIADADTRPVDVEVDWDDVRPLLNDTDNGIVSGSSAAQARPMPLPMVPYSASSVAQAHIRTPAIPKSRATKRLPCPQHANHDQECLIAARMRDAKARRNGPESVVRFEEKLSGALQSLRTAGLLRDRGKTKVHGSRSMGCTTIVVPSLAGVKFPFETIQS